MERTVYLDIETLPTQDEGKRAQFRAEVTPPGQYKKQESIDKWMEENGEAEAEKAIAKTSFNPAHGHICTIGWAIDDEEPIVCHTTRIDEEADVLATFFKALGKFDRATIVGHNVANFDLRFLMCRAVVLGVKVPLWFPRDPKPWDSKVFDTMTAWAGARGTISLDNLCKALDIPGKDGFDGSMVAEAWANGEHEKITEYCKDDVWRVMQIHERFKQAGLA